jgi:hypothetical protein
LGAPSGSRPSVSLARPTRFSNCPIAIAANSRRRSELVRRPPVDRTHSSPPRRLGSGLGVMPRSSHGAGLSPFVA